MIQPPENSLKQLLLIVSLLFTTGFWAQVFDPLSPDEEHLKELVIQKINERRAKRKWKELVLNNELQKTADQYVARFRHTRFENNRNNQNRVHKKIRKNCLANGYKNAFIDFHILSNNALNYPGENYYYDKEDSETSSHLFIGQRPSKKDKDKPGFKSFPLKAYTYDELALLIARNFIRDDGSFVSLNNGYDKFGFALAIDGKTVLRHKIPKLKVILIVGGNRITW